MKWILTDKNPFTTMITKKKFFVVFVIFVVNLCVLSGEQRERRRRIWHQRPVSQKSPKD